MQKRDLMVVSGGFDRQVTQPAVSVHGAPDFDGLLNKRHQTFCGGILNAPHADSSDTRPIFLCSDDDQRLAVCLAPASPFFQASQIRLVHFDSTRQAVATRPHHGPPQLVEPSPGGLVAPQYTQQQPFAGLALSQAPASHSWIWEGTQPALWLRLMDQLEG